MTLDLSSATHHIRPRKKAQQNEKKASPDSSAGADENPPATAQALENEDVTNERDVEMQDDAAEPRSIAMNDNDPSAIPAIEDPEDRIQILDLHSSNPVISYQNQIYSCEWTSTIGTDLLLTAPDPDYPHPILQDEPGVSILAATGIKLFARPVQMTPRTGASTSEKTPNPAPAISNQTNNTSATATQASPIKIPTNLTASKSRENQAKFLEKLIAIKAAKGEKDEVTVFTQKANQGSGWRSHQKALEQEHAAEESEMPDTEAGAPNTPSRRATTRGRGKIGRPRGRRRGRATHGGLFRDYRPQLFDSTPDSWDQLIAPNPAISPQNMVNRIPIPSSSTSHPPRPPVSFQITSPTESHAGPASIGVGMLEASTRSVDPTPTNTSTSPTVTANPTPTNVPSEHRDAAIEPANYEPSSEWVHGMMTGEAAASVAAAAFSDAERMVVDDTAVVVAEGSTAFAPLAAFPASTKPVEDISGPAASDETNPVDFSAAASSANADATIPVVDNPASPSTVEVQMEDV